MLAGKVLKKHISENKLYTKFRLVIRQKSYLI